ncbi:MAG TPA: hypothetical protein VHH73_09200, partial [Verrucomicrobiae bacterium]|nr:hypothetical protein [Verrucomicrobiae bacterium]
LEPQDHNLTANIHFKAFEGRSSFEVRMRHPDGRAAGEAYFRELAALKKPFLYEKPEPAPAGFFGGDFFGDGPWLNPATPLFPTNTIWALVRRAILSDPQGRPVVSPIVESIQMRVYNLIGQDPAKAQTFVEWELRRGASTGKMGFHLTEPGEGIYPHFMGKGFDPFEQPNGRLREEKKPATLDCFSCHAGPGIYSVLSYTRAFSLRQYQPPALQATKFATVAWKAADACWALPFWQCLRWAMD